jgi:signal transduction histidine kinase
MTLARLSKRVLLAETVELPTNSVVLEPDFLLILMHELRTPLQAMLGWTQLVRSTRQDAQAIESALAAIERNIQWQALVIEDLLELARSRSGDLPLEIRRVRVGAVIESAVEQIAEAAAAKRIRVVQRLRGEDGVIRADADRLARGIWRLLSDAVRFTRESGEIEIRSERIGSSIRIIVRDDGGANDSVSSHASGWFRRTASSTADFSAMGVGLGNLQRLVAMHGGQVGAESAGEGRGASFS